MPALLALCCAAAAPVSAQGLRLPGDGGQGGMPSLGGGSSLGSPSGLERSPEPVRVEPRPAVPTVAARAGGPQLADAIVAIVNSEAITRRELETRLVAAQATLRLQGIAQPDRATLEHQVLERMIVERTQLQEAAQNGIRIDDIQLDRAISRIAEQNNVSVSQMRDQIERDGVAFSVYREDLRHEITLVRLRERAVDSRVQVTEADIDGFLADAQQQQQGGGGELRLAQILVRVPEGSASDAVSALRAKAEDLLRQARAGTDFAQLAAAASDGEEALRGGDLGSRPEDRWPSLFSDAVARLKAGEVSDLVRSGNGFHILKVTERSTGGVAEPAAMPVQQTHARHILIRTSEVLSDAQARERLATLRQRIQAGQTTFADMARQYSNDASAPQGGDLGWLSPSETVPEFERAMDALQPGQISEPVRSPFGWHLIEVVGRRTQDVGRERQRAAARQALFQRRVDQMYEDWARQLRDSAYVEVRLERGDAAAQP